MRHQLEQFGCISYLENHVTETNDVIVKFAKRDSAISAFKHLSLTQQVVYVPTKLDSDRNTFINFAESEATFALNILKLKDKNHFEIV